METKCCPFNVDNDEAKLDAQRALMFDRAGVTLARFKTFEKADRLTLNMISIDSSSDMGGV